MTPTDLDVQSLKRFFTLYKLAEMGATRRTIKVSTEYLAAKIGISQQTASRHLIELEEKGWIKRDPYPGTLNLKLATEYDMKTRSELDVYPAVEIQGFTDESRTFGAVKCYPAVINNKVKGAVLSALRSHYDSSVLEVIASTFLRSQLKLKDGNKVKVEVLTLP